MIHFAKQIGTAAEPIFATAGQSFESVVIKALSTNSNKVYIGLTGVTAANGFELSAGEGIELPRAFGGDLSNIFVIGGAASQEVRGLAA